MRFASHARFLEVLDTVQLHATVRGYVQGVGFRAFVCRRAYALGLVGYVRNTREGDVEVLAEGPRRGAEALLGDLQRGPGEAEVSSVDTAWGKPQGGLTRFEVRY